LFIFALRAAHTAMITIPSKNNTDITDNDIISFRSVLLVASSQKALAVSDKHLEIIIIIIIITPVIITEYLYGVY